VIDWLVRFRGKKFNGPADVTFTQTGNLYFTDSPFALATTGDEMLSTNLTVLNAKRDLPFNGVFRRTQNDTQVLDANMTRPRSIAFSPDEDVMYVANADATNPYIKAFKLKADGSKECARTFFDFGNNKLNVDGKPTNKSVTCFRQYPTSVKVDSDGFVYVVMCNNIYVLDGAGTLLGRIEGDAEIHTLALGNGYIYIASENNVFALSMDPVFGNSQPPVSNPQSGCAMTTASSLNDTSMTEATSLAKVFLGAGIAAGLAAALAIFSISQKASKKKNNNQPPRGGFILADTPPRAHPSHEF
ncbi:hypothetical protein As57867_018412, partial [Aphanomyces stellatus]